VSDVFYSTFEAIVYGYFLLLEGRPYQPLKSSNQKFQISDSIPSYSLIILYIVMLTNVTNVNLKFTFGTEELEIVNQYRYLGIVFSSSCVFRKAAEDAKRKGMMALGSTWSLFQRSKVNEWDTHRKFFDSLVASTSLYASHIWAPNYKDIIEKVQSRFLRRLLHLDFKTPTFALRLEPKSQKLHFAITKLQINFVMRLLHMPPTRVCKISFNALKITAGTDTKRFNWFTQLSDEFKRLNFESLC
jgi:hypothetical protein